ncbi:MAG: type II toxin-antitoxin system VapC family toxin [Deltaproteobacteria bacterium]|nr:type II toxin-antitoxin system VapC family toxin [Deltaproteobacteria bacterium]
MTCLLDTHVLLWWIYADRRLSTVARGLIADPSNRILVSSASAWEIATKHRLGKLRGADTLVRDIAGWIGRAGFTELPVTIADAQRAGSYPHPHRDPFDRMLAAQSAGQDVPLVTSDRALRQFGLKLVW